MARRKIAGSRAVVTGASSGIGRAVARDLARHGARLIVTARREERLVELVEELKSLGADAHYVVGDITDPGLREKLIDTAKTKFGALDILINNAGSGAIGPFAEADAERMRGIMEVNFFAPVETTRVALPLLRAGTKPIIVNVGSVLGHRAVPKKSEYCASKFALHGFSDALRAELIGEKIDVLLVSPSTTESEFFDTAIGDEADLPWLALGRMSAEAVARRTVRAIRSGRHEIILTPGGKLLVWFDRLMPPIVNRLVAKFG